MRDVGYTFEDADRFLVFVDRVLDRLLGLRAQQNLDDWALKYLRATIKKYNDIRHTYKDRRPPVEENCKRQGRHRKKRDYSYKAFKSDQTEREERMDSIALRAKRQKLQVGSLDMYFPSISALLAWDINICEIHSLFLLLSCVGLQSLFHRYIRHLARTFTNNGLKDAIYS